MSGFKDVSELHIREPERFDEILDAAIQAAAPLSQVHGALSERPRRRRAAADEDEEGKQPTQADRLVGYAESEATLFKTPLGVAHATIRAAGHREVWAVKSRGFKDWLLFRYFEETGRAPNAEALSQAIAALEAFAKFKGGTAPVFLRTASLGPKLYVDLCDEAWRAIEIEGSGWRVLAEPPVFFARARGMLALPEPERGGSISELKALLNLSREDDFKLIVGWLLSALRPTGPYPILALTGEAGSAKSTAAKTLRRADRSQRLSLALRAERRARSLHRCLQRRLPHLRQSVLDPALALRRALPRRNRRRLRHPRPSHRQRGGAVRGIASDLPDQRRRRDRALRSRRPHDFIALGPIVDGDRVPDEVFAQRLDVAAPRVLAALLDGLAHGLAEKESPEPARLPRMASFIAWTAACEGAFWEEAPFKRPFIATAWRLSTACSKGTPSRCRSWRF